jgi:hypothetical protein
MDRSLHVRKFAAAASISVLHWVLTSDAVPAVHVRPLQETTAVRQNYPVFPTVGTMFPKLTDDLNSTHDNADNLNRKLD